VASWADMRLQTGSGVTLSRSLCSTYPTRSTNHPRRCQESTLLQPCLAHLVASSNSLLSKPQSPETTMPSRHHLLVNLIIRRGCTMRKFTVHHKRQCVLVWHMVTWHHQLHLKVNIFSLATIKATLQDVPLHHPHLATDTIHNNKCSSRISHTTSCHTTSCLWSQPAAHGPFCGCFSNGNFAPIIPKASRCHLICNTICTRSIMCGISVSNSWH